MKTIFTSIIVLAIVCVTVSIVDRTYFNYLGLPITATLSDVQNAYQQKKIKIDALEDGEEKEKKIQLLTEAYEVLSNDKERQRYERYGKELFKSIKQITSINKMNPERPTDSRKGLPFKLTVPISIVDNFNGTVVRAKYFKAGACSTCRGTGAASPKELHGCNQCGGKGFNIVETKNYMGQNIKLENICPVCKGQGKLIGKTCNSCKGNKLMKKLETIQLKIPAGTASGSKLTFTNYGEEPEIGAPSDFEVTVIEIPTPQWQRDGDNLIYTMEISLQMALLGFSETIVHLSGERILVDRQDKTTTKDTKHMIMGKGLSNKQGYSGNLVVKFKIIFPKFTSDQLNMWEDYFQEFGTQ